MRDFLLNGEERLDKNMVSLMKQKMGHVLFPCKWVRYNDKIKVYYNTDNYRSLENVKESYTLSQIRTVIRNLLLVVKELEKYPEISKENIVWAYDSIYMDEKDNIRLICLPVLQDADNETDTIYKKRIYAMIEDLINQSEEGNLLYRRVVFQQEHSFGNWDGVMETMEGDILQDDSIVFLQRIDIEEAIPFPVAHEDLTIGKDNETCAIVLDGEDVAFRHAMFGWNEISYYIMDLFTDSGTYVNGTKIASGVQIPVGKGTDIRIGHVEFRIM